MTMVPSRRVRRRQRTTTSASALSLRFGRHGTGAHGTLLTLSVARSPFLVTIKGRESLNPHTWSVGYRWAITGLAGLLVLNASESRTLSTCRGRAAATSGRRASEPHRPRTHLHSRCASC